MSTKDTYSADEWAAITTAPMLAGSYISLSDPGITSILGESAAMMKAMTQGEVPPDAKALVDSIMAGLQQMQESKERPQMPELTEDQKKNPAAAKAELLEQIAKATAAVTAKGSPAEATAYKKWVMSVATATAEAAKEGGFMGIGGKRVSAEEEAALAELGTAMGI